MSAADVRLAADAIARQRGDRHLLLFIDFDGTLCEFDPDPEAVHLIPERQLLLDRIAADATVALVSGRRLSDVRSRCGLHAPVWYAGLHGLEIVGPGAAFEHPGIAQAASHLHSLSATIAADLSRIPGAFLEDKGLSLVAHFRAAAPDDAVEAAGILMRHAKPHLDAGALRTMAGACMIELLPNIEWHKGSAVDWIRDRVSAGHRDSWPLYIGDDITDEDGFRAVQGRGLSVAASSRAGGADFAVDGPGEVEALLREIAAGLAVHSRR
jgi:trehalose-phosphatase